MFLSPGNEILADAIGSRLLDGVREPCEITVADFDDVMFKLIVAAGQENLLALHIAMPAAEALRAIGCEQVVERVYPGMKGAPVDGYSFCVCVDADACAEPGAMLEKLTLLKRHIVGAPFTLAFEALMSDSVANTVTSFAHHKSEMCYVVPGADPAKPTQYDRVTVVFAIDFPEESDKAFARIIMQQFVETQRKVNNAPPTVFSEPNKPPKECEAAGALPTMDGVGFISFTFFKRHVNTPEKLAKVVEMLVGFRNYMQYHIKASKTALHMRMRKKVNGWLQVLNRAFMPAEEKEKKTSSGKTFTRK